MNDRVLGMIGLAVRAGKVSFGVFMTEKALDEGRAKLVVAAEDIGISNRRRIENKCNEFSVKLMFYSDKATLSRAAGKKDMPVLAVCDDGFAQAIVKKHNDVHTH
ncbi:MAG: ribosomal L7Ae/L30e/S12e/Gadd45 family protein [Clostridia bacterium]|nr:ribosomal L7Ae/L30e/S12e/Gadd45 family protein [Clostridia bacterium]